ncbi:Aste57867_21072 [Aphanomyces stellatus]|uniref:Aste57867_21072 protein n=1 Tax=Aphanomyces stellatus TaxID=120398 RepID=A0A485LHA4_9STRA|nr:hypothetical protein As57867_021004 [Aphanomyces stellatus]VFT97746.1 Aste57867_21072 [Aphanomyces stellatus]
MTQIFAYQRGLRFNNYLLHLVGKAAWELSPSAYGLVDNDRRLVVMHKTGVILSLWYDLHGSVANAIASTRGETHISILAAHCAFQGDLPALRLLVQKFEVHCSKANLIDWAACNGHLDVIEFLHTSMAGVAKNTPWAMEVAAAHGHLPVVQWLHHHRGQRMSTIAMVAAAVHGHLDILEWLLGHKTYRGAKEPLILHEATTVECKWCKSKKSVVRSRDGFFSRARRMVDTRAPTIWGFENAH